jgi:hypothetical protein
MDDLEIWQYLDESSKNDAANLACEVLYSKKKQNLRASRQASGRRSRIPSRCAVRFRGTTVENDAFHAHGGCLPPLPSVSNDSGSAATLSSAPAAPASATRGAPPPRLARN